MLESDLQKYFVKILYTIPSIFFHSVPNESKRTHYYGNHLKKMGLRSGVPDMIILKDGEVFYIELKSKNGKLTKNQKFIKEEIIENGGNYFLLNSIESINLFLKDNIYGNQKNY